jgi:hypothetical protein
MPYLMGKGEAGQGILWRVRNHHPRNQRSYRRLMIRALESLYGKLKKLASL